MKSVNLDTWSPEQVVSLQQMGNSRARAVYEALLSDNFRRPQTDSGLESFIRSKYEHKKYIAREWVPPPPIKVDWDKEIEEEIENQKRKKKSSTSSASSIVPALPEPAKSSSPSAATIAIPAPLPKPQSPKTARLEAKKSTASPSNTLDLLGITLDNSGTPSAPQQQPKSVDTTSSVNNTSSNPESFDFFANFSSAPVLPEPTPGEAPKRAALQQANNGTPKSNENSLQQEEEDFFNQKTLENGSGDKGAKLTKDSILALYGSQPMFTPPPSSQPQQQQQYNPTFQQYPGVPQDQFFVFGQQTTPSNHANNFYNQPAAPAQPQAFAQPQQQQQTAFNGNFGGLGGFNSTMQAQQINKLNEENIRKIESLNFNNNSFK